MSCLITLIINYALAPSTRLIPNKYTSLTQRCLSAVKVVTTSKPGWRSRCHNSDRVSQNLATTRPGCRDEAGPRSHREATSGSARYRARRGTPTAQPTQGPGPRPGLECGWPGQGAEGARGKAPDEPSHSSSSQASGLL